MPASAINDWQKKAKQSNPAAKNFRILSEVELEQAFLDKKILA